MDLTAANVKLPPGVRFHPTDEELVMHYLKRKLLGKPLEVGLVTEVDIYQYHPANLRELACFNQELLWYFFCAIRKKYGSGDRKKRSTQSGYWKPTGNPRDVLHRKRIVGKVRTLVYYEGKSEKGKKTNWVMYEYGVEESELANKGVSDALVLCKIFEKDGSGPSRNGEQFGAPYNEEEWNAEEENSPVANVGVQDQSASVVINGLVSSDISLNPLPTLEQVDSGAVSVSGVHQAHISTSDGANEQAANKMFDSIPKADVDLESYFENPLLIFDDDINFEYVGLSMDDLEPPLPR